MPTNYYDDVFSVDGWQSLPTFHDLRGKTIFITGGGSGLGAYFTAAFALQGAKIGFVSLNQVPATQLCDQVEDKTQQRPLAIKCDIKDIPAMHDAIGKISEQVGSIDVLINNAARDTRHSLEEFTPEQWDESISTNLKPQFFSIQAAYHDMKKSGQGSIINIGSNSYNLGLSGYPTYVTAKAGIIGMTKALARELGSENIRVNALVPGWVMTERQKRLWVNKKDLNACLTEQSIKRPLNGWEVASSALFLASNASSMITGQEIIIDGGRV